MVKQILKNNSKNRKFLKDFVVLIIPMLNPDGVINGYTRLDTNGFNLNAHYNLADSKTPSISSLLQLVKYIDEEGTLFAFFDLHAHLTKRGIFFFGNPFKEKNFEQILEIPLLFNSLQKDFNLNTSSKYYKYREIYTKILPYNY